MNKTHINNPYRNPFHNRFHVPVHSRLDEMQSYSHQPGSDEQTENGKSRIPALVGAFALVLLVAASAVFLAKLSL